MFNLDAIRVQAKKFNMELAIEGMTFQPQVVDGKATQKRARREEAGGELINQNHYQNLQMGRYK